MIGRRKFLSFLTLFGFAKTRGAVEPGAALPVSILPAPVTESLSCPEPDPSTVLREAHSLAKRGDFEAALLKHIWFHENAVRLRRSLSAVRLSFGLGYWAELGEKYPKAKAALLEIQEKNRKSLEMGQGNFEVFQEIAAIDRYLGEPARTVESFRTLRSIDPELAESCYVVAEEALVDQEAFEDCDAYLANPEAMLRQSVECWTLSTEHFADREYARDATNANFIKAVSRLILILTRVGRTEEAEKIRAEALLTLDDEKLRNAGK